MASQGKSLKGVRLDSGDIARLSQKVRKILSEKGLDRATIFASGGFDEYTIQKVLKQGGNIDSFGVGTKMGVSADAPYFDMAYKMVEYDGRSVLKLSPQKSTLASAKQVFRFKTPKGRLSRDVIGLRDDHLKAGEPLLEEVMRQGKVVVSTPPLSQIQERFLDEFSCLDEKYKSLAKNVPEYPVVLSPKLKSLQAQLVRRLKARVRKELGES
jgi:nicotinate phosphoribosyltransferase